MRHPILNNRNLFWFFFLPRDPKVKHVSNTKQSLL
uniref:Uncharacterized protein n=1 Tax=Anguilla anguilla TaxID=7936 RepID=A0A0E9V7M9_ANGAN